MGMCVEVVWKLWEWWGLGIDNIEYFCFIGELDVNYDIYKYYL